MPTPSTTKQLEQPGQPPEPGQSKHAGKSSQSIQPGQRIDEPGQTDKEGESSGNEQASIDNQQAEKLHIDTVITAVIIPNDGITENRIDKQEQLKRADSDQDMFIGDEQAKPTTPG